MTSTSFRPARRAVVAAAAALPLGAALAACSSDTGDAPSLGGGSDDGGASSAYDGVIAGGPVADDADVQKSAWAKKIKDAGKLTRGGTTANQVFSLIDPSTNKVTGFDAGITQLLARYILGDGGEEKVDYVDTTVDTREKLVQNNSVDCVIATYSITPERMDLIDFGGPYYLSGTAIQVRTEDKDSITGPEDLTGKKLVTQSNSTGIQAIEEHVKDPGKTETLADNESCVAALKQKRVDAYVLDQGVLLGNSKADPSVTVVGKPFTEDPYGIGLNKDSDALDFVNGFLKAIEDDGTWKKLYEATIGQVIEDETPEPPTIGDLPS
ncbi:glutamate ABC transporter substrate-binding protein [Brachybacterium halotolerans subsp. kimchii]|uniref:glutamate ABC transporter substrate-binding protein n=1 Tax=Brachybacterium halotolerans TaxID=2795215 RepID=UPI001E5C2F96|nr:glutamate ABC transporter substrate-binding protein [Brachybacterium halotolerans]UEJ84464.1 glutamate ABC transporter substrate-binding protein [Brachybacterium halotolerans subsp. kimchii]